MVDNPSFEQQVEMKYDTFLRKSLVNEKKWFMRDFREQLESEFLFSELDEGREESFSDESALESFGKADAEFKVLQYTVAVRDALLYEALTQISEQSRNIILMAFWLDMTDQDIADETGMKRRTVNDIRNKTYKKLKEILEADGYEASSFFPADKL